MALLVAICETRHELGASLAFVFARVRKVVLLYWPHGSGTGSATAGGAAADLVLATFGHLATTGRFELGDEAIVVAVRAIRALQCAPVGVDEMLV